MRALSIRSWTEPFPECRGTAVVFDIFRCSTTMHCLGSLADTPLFIAPSLEAASSDPRTGGLRVFSELSRAVECRERYDNSPKRALEPRSSSASLVATTTGTPAMFASRRFDRVLVGSLVGFSRLVAELAASTEPVTLIPAAFPDALHVEDEIACQAVATALEGFSDLPEFVRRCGERAREQILSSPRPEMLRKKIPTGAEDVAIALSLDRFPALLSLRFDESALARVERSE